jgi:hypothetical protein
VADVLLFSLSFALGILVPAYVVRQDMKQLSAEQRARSWPDSSYWAAVVVFGPLCLPVHFIKTRRTWLSVLLALGNLVDALLSVALPVELLGRILQIPP